MKLQHIPLVLFAGAAILFGLCAVLQFAAGDVGLGILFAGIAIIGVVLFLVLRSGRVSW